MILRISIICSIIFFITIFCVKIILNIYSFEVKIINYSNKIKNEEALEDLIEKQKYDDYNVLYFTERYKGKKNETMDKFYTDMYIIVDQMIRAGYLEYKNYNKVD